MTVLRRSDALFLAIAGGAIVFGVWLNPLLTTRLERDRTTLGIVALAALAAAALEVVRQLRRSESLHRATPAPPLTLGSVASFWLVAAAWAVLYRFPWMNFRFFADDFRYFNESGFWWDEARPHLFKPFNEHMVVGTRIATFLIYSYATAAWQGKQIEYWCGVYCAWLFVGTLFLLFLLLRKFGGGDLPALLGAVWFAVSICHAEVVVWYSAAQWLIPTSLLLGALLLIERTGLLRLAGASTLAALGPWNYTLGALVGPATTLWLFGWHRRWRWSSVLPAVVGSASTLVALIVVRRSMGDEQYWESGGRGMFEAFSPWMGLIYSARLFVDRLLLTNLGYRGLPMSLLIASVVAALVGVAVVVALRRFPRLAVLWPMALVVLLGYGAAIPFRTWQPYESLVDWNRYQLIPHLGMSMLLAGAVGFAPAARGGINGRKLVWFIAGLCLWTFWQRRTYL